MNSFSSRNNKPSNFLHCQALLYNLHFGLSETLRPDGALAEKGNQGLAWSEQEDELLAQRFGNGAKITEIAKLHARSYDAIKQG